MLVRVKVERVTLDTATSRFVVILKDMNQNRWLPIVVGSTEAQAIALQLENISPPRPLTHDLVKNLLESLNVTVSRIVVNDLHENTYYALIGVQTNGMSSDIDARPSDAIALALRMDSPIFVEDQVMLKASISENTHQEAEPAEDDEMGPGDHLEKLNIQLREAVKEERYEEAAQIRDEIKNLQSSLREKTS